MELKVDGHFLYGAPASDLQLEGDMLVAPPTARPGFAGYQFGVDDEETTSNERTPIENLPESDDKGVATFPVSLAKPPTSTRPQEAQIFIRMAEAGGRAVERKLVLPVAPAQRDDRRQAAVRRQERRGRRQGRVRRRVRLARRQDAGARRPALRAAEDRVALSMVPAEFVLGLRAGQDDRRASPTAT